MLDNKYFAIDSSMNLISMNEYVGLIDCRWETDGALNRFVTSADHGNSIKLAESNSYVAGVSIDEDEEVVTIQTIGIVKIQSQISLRAGDKVMPSVDGLPMKSTNGLGYRVVEDLGDGYYNIIIAPNVDMIQRAKVRDGELQGEIEKLKIKYGTDEPSGGNDGDIYIQLAK